MSGTRFPDLFNALAARFDKTEVKALPRGNKQVPYVTARTVMNRLDSTLGPENWFDEYVPLEHSVVCKLTIKLPDGSLLTKADAGAYAGMADEGDDDKSGFSDALKRAAAKFGVGRYLYGDGVPIHAADRGQAQASPGPRKRETPETWEALFAQTMVCWAGFQPIADDRDNIARQQRIYNRVVSAAIQAGKLDEATVTRENDKGEVVRDADKVRPAARDLFDRDREWVASVLRKYLVAKGKQAMSPPATAAGR